MPRPPRDPEQDKKDTDKWIHSTPKGGKGK